MRLLVVILSPGILNEIVECIKASPGRPAWLCAISKGLSYSQYMDWMSDGGHEDCSDALKRRFFLDISSAMADSQIQIIDSIASHAEADWRAGDKLLKIANPDAFDDKKVKVTVSGEVKQTHVNRYEIGVGEIGELIGILRDYVGTEAIVGPAGEIAASSTGTYRGSAEGDIIDVDSEVE
jgi:hypothetical protein